MSPALSLTRDDLVRVLSRLAERPAVDRAVGERAEVLARDIGPDARVVREGPGAYVVTVGRARGDAS